jgi:hypothetical protein
MEINIVMDIPVLEVKVTKAFLIPFIEAFGALNPEHVVTLTINGGIPIEMVEGLFYEPV